MVGVSPHPDHPSFHLFRRWTWQGTSPSLQHLMRNNYLGSSSSSCRLRQQHRAARLTKTRKREAKHLPLPQPRKQHRSRVVIVLVSNRRLCCFRIHRRCDKPSCFAWIKAWRAIQKCVASARVEQRKTNWQLKSEILSKKNSLQRRASRLTNNSWPLSKQQQSSQQVNSSKLLAVAATLITMALVVTLQVPWWVVAWHKTEQW